MGIFSTLFTKKLTIEELELEKRQRQRLQRRLDLRLRQIAQKDDAIRKQALKASSKPELRRIFIKLKELEFERRPLEKESLLCAKEVMTLTLVLGKMKMAEKLKGKEGIGKLLERLKMSGLDRLLDSAEISVEQYSQHLDNVLEEAAIGEEAFEDTESLYAKGFEEFEKSIKVMQELDKEDPERAIEVWDKDVKKKVAPEEEMLGA